MIRLNPGLEALPYAHEANHRLLASDALVASGQNIGDRGENLTITCLSLNRAQLTVKLLDSIRDVIPHFAGKILIVDNGSGADQLTCLHRYLAECRFPVRIVALKSNHGVGGGRNRAMLHVETEWVMCLDNDIYFCADILPAVQDAIALLGCHFLSLPLLNSDGTPFARGGHIYVGSGEEAVHIGGGSAASVAADYTRPLSPFLCTFLFGGASVFRKDRFRALGGYDESMFVGFEDIDFSVRLFREGMKVGSIGAFGLIHDHPRPQTAADIAYERNRFSKGLLAKSAAHLESKYGFKVWDHGVEAWLAQRHEALALASGDHDDPSPAGPFAEVAAGSASGWRKSDPALPRVALVVDTEGWALANIARQLERHLRGAFEIEIIATDTLDSVEQALLLAEHCSIVHFFWRDGLRIIPEDYCRRRIESLGLSFSDFSRRFMTSRKVSFSVYDHLFLSDAEVEARTKLFTSLADAYTVSSARLAEIYGAIARYPRPSAVIPDGVDLETFRPLNLDRLAKLRERPVVVGWAGNSEWAGNGDHKGLRSVIIPAIESLRAEGFDIVAEFADSSVRSRPLSEMPSYYHGIDIHLCASLAEGTPNPILEAMASGVPFVSTDVGIVPEAAGPIQSRFIVDRSPDAFAHAIRTLITEPGLAQRISEESLQRIRNWNWPVQAAKFGTFFRQLLSK